MFLRDLNLFAFLIPVVFAAACMLVPDLWSRDLMQLMKWEQTADVPQFLDLLAVGLLAGGGQFDYALVQVARQFPGPFGDVLRDAVRGQELGLRRREVLEQVARQVGSQDLRDFTAAVAVATELGTPLADLTARQADDARRRQEQAAERQGRLASVLMVIPLTVFIVPSIFMLMLAPAVITIIEQLSR